jgi:hypothetical protein
MSALSVPQMADRLGVSEATIRRRLKVGTLRATQRATPQGFVYEIEAPEGDIPALAPPKPREDYVAHLEAEIALLRRVVDALLREK